MVGGEWWVVNDATSQWFLATTDVFEMATCFHLFASATKLTA